MILLVLCLAAVTLSAAEPDEPHRCGFLTQVERASARRSTPGILGLEQRPSLPLSIDSPSGRFRVHYTLSGPDAVPSADWNDDGIPDYIDSTLFALESAWTSFIDEQGYAPPPSDGMAGGSPAFDVYLRDLSTAGSSGLGMYGQTVPDSTFQRGPVQRSTSWMEVDNNFDSTDRNVFDKPVYYTTGFDALHVTIVHEFHHVVQIGSYALSYEQVSFYELTSTWMEMRDVPKVYDYEQYLRSLLTDPTKAPFSSTRGAHGYAWAWWGEYLATEVSEETIRATWDGIATGVLPFEAHAAAIAQRGTSIAAAMCDAIDWLYYTGDRANGNAQLPNAANLPALHLEYEGYAPASGITLSSALLPLESKCYQFLVPTTDGNGTISVEFATVNEDEESYIAANDKRTPCTVRLSPTEQPGWRPVPGTTWSWTVEGACVHTFESSMPVTNNGPYPQPFDRRTMSTLFLPVPPSLLGMTATVTTYTADMIAVRTDELTAVLDNHHVSLPWTQAQELNHGVYILEVESSTHHELLKVIVK